LRYGVQFRPQMHRLLYLRLRIEIPPGYAPGCERSDQSFTLIPPIGRAGRDVGAWINSAIAALHGKGGEVHIETGVYKQSTPVTVRDPQVSVIGAGASSVYITCTLNTSCWLIRIAPFVIAPAGRIGGFTLVGQGSSHPDAVGVRTGDIIGATFYDLHIDNFRGKNSAAFWIENHTGWFERNFLENIELGIHCPRSIQEGNTKNIRITNSGDAANNSISRNTLINVHMTLRSGDVGFSVEGATNAPFITGNFWQGGANLYDGGTMFSFQGSSVLQDSDLFWQQECTVCSAGATVFDVGPAAVVHYRGQVTNGGKLSNNIAGVFTSEISSDAQAPVLDRRYFDSASYNSAAVNPSGVMLHQAGDYVRGEGPNVALKAFNAVGIWGVEYVGPYHSEHYWCTNNDTPACVERMRLSASGRLQLGSLAGQGTRCLHVDEAGYISASSFECSVAASLTTTAAASDTVPITGFAAKGHCSLSATNASAAKNLQTTYVSSKAKDQITIAHPAIAGMTYDILCVSD